MAYQKLQTYQAIQVIKDDNIVIPAPNQVASGTATGAASYGYVPLNDEVDKWDADYVFHDPLEILKII